MKAVKRCLAEIPKREKWDRRDKRNSELDIGDNSHLLERVTLSCPHEKKQK